MPLLGLARPRTSEACPYIHERGEADVPERGSEAVGRPQPAGPSQHKGPLSEQGAKQSVFVIAFCLALLYHDFSPCQPENVGIFSGSFAGRPPVPFMGRPLAAEMRDVLAAVGLT